ncbi:hypothetical protein DSUL_90062 [Desulfovibrionales bacterium]
MNSRKKLKIIHAMPYGLFSEDCKNIIHFTHRLTARCYFF